MATDVGRILAVRKTATGVLLAWGVGSIVIGAAVARLGDSDPVDDAFSMQFCIWGTINAGLALFGLWSERRPTTPHTAVADARNLLGVLRWSQRSNVLWLAIGVGLLAWGMARPSAVLIAHGASVVVQGGFLMTYDAWLARALRREVPGRDPTTV